MLPVRSGTGHSSVISPGPKAAIHPHLHGPRQPLSKVRRQDFVQRVHCDPCLLLSLTSTPFLWPRGGGNGLLRGLVPRISAQPGSRRGGGSGGRREDARISTVPIQERVCLLGKKQGTADSDPYTTHFRKSGILQALTPVYVGHSLTLGGR